ncbi:MAG TPA: TraB/GumN family protein [Candidatus Bathyarchaeia archaeon]|nr:TraB/GumN family protein [Candidatus Bathyarchaeia archaeon]
METVSDRLTLVGTIHVDPASGSFVRETILCLKPEVVCLELDEARLASLLRPSDRRGTFSGGAPFLIIALLEKFAGNITGSSPGGEMVQAVEAARMVGSRIQLVDLPISSTIKALRKLPLKEKATLGLDSILSFVLLPFGRLNFSKLTQDFDDQIRLFRRRYPELSRILLDVREDYMADRIRNILDMTSGQVVAVVGYGHMRSLAKRLESTKSRRPFSTTLTWQVSTAN